MLIIFLLIPFMDIIAANPYPMNSKRTRLEFKSGIEFKSEEIGNSNSVINFLKELIKKFISCSSNEPNETDQKEIVFRSYLQKLGCIIKKFDDVDFKFLLDTAVRELDKYYMGKKKTHPFLFNKKMRDYIASRMGVTKNGTVDKSKVADVLEKNNKTLVDAEFFGLLSKIFSMEDLATFQIHLKTLNAFPKNKNRHKLAKAVKEFERSLINAYEKLDEEKKYQLDMAVTDIFDKDETYKKHKNIKYKRHKFHRRVPEIDENIGEIDRDNLVEVLNNTAIIEAHSNLSLKENDSSPNIEGQLGLSPTPSARPVPSCALTTGVTHPANENLMELARGNVEELKRKTDVNKSSTVPSTTAIFY